MKIVGGGLAGLAAAARLGAAGLPVEMHEARRFLGGRASSIPSPGIGTASGRIDNCQHVLLRCCTQLLDFYRRCGVESKIRFHSALHVVTPGGAVDTVRADPLPAPLHLARSLLSMRCLDWRDKLSLARCLRAARRERPGPDDVSFADWLRARGATPRSVARFWRPFVVSALNEEPERASARPAIQVFSEGLLSSRDSFEMGTPTVPLDSLYSAALAGCLGPSVRVILGSRVRRIDPSSKEADFYVSAVPFDRVEGLVPGLGIAGQLARFEHSPITGIHLWFDRPITALEHAMLLDRQIQWLFHKGGGYYLVVVSASRELASVPARDIVELAVRELREFFPEARRSALAASRVIREARATFSARPGMERLRPGPRTPHANVFLAGDWTDTGWPATMEGAVRSGYRAAEAVLSAARDGRRTGDGTAPRAPARTPAAS